MLTQKKIHPLFLLLSAFLAHRLFFILTANPLHLFVFRMEELYRGAMAQIFNLYSWAGLYEFRPDDYAGGSYVIALLASLSFKLCSPSLFSLKLVSVLWSAAALFFWFRAIEKWQDRKTAVFFGLLCIFCPPSFLKYTLTPLGDHAETILFTGISLCLLKDILEKPSGIKTFLLGLISGFGAWFSYTHAISVLALLIFWQFQQPGFFKKKPFLPFVAGAAAGFSPWLVTNFLSGGMGAVVQGKPLWESFHPKFFIKKIINFRDSSVYQLFSSFDTGEPPFAASRTVIWFYRLALVFPPLLLIVHLLRRWKKEGVLPLKLPLFTLGYMAIFCLTAQSVEYSALRYFIPLHPALYFLAASGVTKFRQSAAIGFILLYCTAGLAIHSRMISLSQAGYALRTSSTNYSWLTGSPICSNSDRCLEGFKKLEPHLNLEDKQSISLSLGLALASDLPFKNLSQELGQAEKKIPENLLGTFYYALGYEVFARENQNFLKTLQILKENTGSRPVRLYELSIHGALDVAMNSFEPVTTAQMLEIEKYVPDFAREEYWRKRGFEWCQLYLHDKKTSLPFSKSLKQITASLPETVKPLFHQGLGHGLLGHWRINRMNKKFSARDYESLPPEIRRKIVEGAGISSSKIPEWDQLVYKTMFLEISGGEFEAEFQAQLKERDRLWNKLGYSF